MWAAVALSLVVVAYNTVTNRWKPFHGAAYVPVNLAFASIVTAVAVAASGIASTEVLPRGNIERALAALLLVALFALVALSIALSRHAQRIADRRIRAWRGTALIYYALVRIPLGTSAVEEVLFRGVLFAVWMDAGASRSVAAVCASIAFGLWHISPSAIALRMNDPHASKTTVRVTVLGAILLTTVAGLALTWLRVWSGGLLAPILLHAGINSSGAVAAVLASRRVDGNGDPEPLAVQR